MKNNKEKNSKNNPQIIDGKRVQAFLHSGGLGDIIWSLPFIISQEGGDLYIRNHCQVSATNRQFNGLFKILTCQPYFRKIMEYPQEYGEKEMFGKGSKMGKINTNKKVEYSSEIELDFDLDYFRISPKLNKEHLITSYFTVNNVPTSKLPLPFIILDENFDFKNKELNKRVEIPNGKFNSFHITQRYRCEFDWEKLIKNQKNPNYYIGLKEEYDDIIKDYDVKEDLIFYGDKVKDMFDMAIMIKNSDKFYCNPSVAQCLAVGLNKPYTLVKNKNQGGFQTNLPMETVINK